MKKFTILYLLHTAQLKCNQRVVLKYLSITVFLGLSFVNAYAQQDNLSAPKMKIVSSKQVQLSSNEQVLWKNEPFGERDGSRELLEKRDAFSKHFQNDNGSISAHIASGPIHYKENGKWKTIYHTIEPTSNGGFQNIYNNFKTYYPATSNGEIVTILSDGTELHDMQGMRMYYEVNGQEVGSIDIAGASGSADFNKLIYAAVYGNQIDLRLTQNSTQRKMDYILKNASALNGAPQNAQYMVFEEKIILPQGITARLIDNKIILTNLREEVIAEYTNPEIYDEQASETTNENYEPRSEAAYQIEQNGTMLTIKTKVDMTWLLDANRNFPIVVDPTVNVIQFSNNQSGRIAVVRNNANSQNFTGYQSCDALYNGYYAAGTDFAVGRWSNTGTGGAKRSRFLFSQNTFNISAIPTGSAINAAELYYTVYTYSGTQNGTLSIRKHTINQPATCDNVYNGFNATQYFTNGTYTPGLKNGSIATNEISTQLASGWFGVGYYPSGNYAGANRFWIIDGVYETSRPYIVVNYTEPDCGTSSTTPILNNDNTGITNVTFNTINNTTLSNNTYVNTGISTSLCKGNSYNLSVRVNTDGNWTVRARAWIDWNNDGVFSNTTESYDLGTAVNTADGVTSAPANITVPLSAATATVKMRIVAAEISNYPYACANNYYGEGEDYLLIVNPNPSVTANASAASICEGQSVTLTGGGANTYSWNNSAINNTPIFPTTTTTYTVTGTAANSCINTATVTVTVNNTADFANLQWPLNATIDCGANVAVYGKIYEAALTPTAGSNGTISVQVGVSTTNTDPSTWAAGAWTNATYNLQVGNDDEYLASIGSALAPGTYYYSFRYQIGSSGCYRYGGYSASNGGFWNGTTNVNGTLIINGSTIDWANIQFPTSGSVCAGSNYTVYGQVYEAGVTDPAGAASGLIAEIGVSSANTNPNTWAAGAWSSASFNGQVGNNDEFVANIGSTLTPGTYYYAYRYKLANTCNYQYGGTSGFYDGTSSVNGVLVVNTAPSATLSTSSASVCNGQQVTLSGTVTATGAWTLNLSNGQTATGTGNGSWSLTTLPTATTTYSISSLTTAGCAATLSGASTITVPTGTALSSNNEAGTCLVNQSGWIHFYTSGASPKLIGSINSQGQNLGNVTITSFVDGSNALVPACTNSNPIYATNVLQRHWVITPTTQPTGPVLIRLPHTSAEFSSLSAAASTNANSNDEIVVPQDLDLTKYSNSSNAGLVDGDALNNCGSGTSSFHQQTNYGSTSSYSGVNANFAEFSISGFSEFWLHGSATSSPLPVELVNFQANCAGDGKVAVTWATASEHNSANFTVEKSRDGINWSVLATVAGAGNATQLINYSVDDNNSAAGVNYYRLTQTDVDGASETFNIASANCGDNAPLTTVKVYPNPSAGDFYIDFSSEEIIGSSVITIADARGMEVYKMNVTVEKGNNVFHIENIEVAPGMYYIKVSNGTTTSSIVKHSLR